MRILYTIEGILIGIIGRPILWFIKVSRWMFLIFGIYFSQISKYHPITEIEETEFTIIPIIIGLILFSIGSTVKRYDENMKNFYERFY